MKTLLLLLIGFCIPATSFAATLAELQSGWAKAMYEQPADNREAALRTLADEARQTVKAQPNDPELLIWQGIIISTLAGEDGGLGALGLAKESKKALEQALSIDPTALQGSAYTSLGTLHHKVPGWPIAFGSDKKARQLLAKALEINPHGIDPNYFMGEFLYDEGEPAKAKEHLLIARQAPPRPDRPIADKGRLQEIDALMTKVEKALR